MSTDTTPIGHKDILFNYNGKGYAVNYLKSTAANVNYGLVAEEEATPSDNKLTIEVPPRGLTERKVVVLDSVNSGVGRENRDFYSAVLNPLLGIFGIEHEYIKTESKNSIKEFAKQLDQYTKYTLIFISGDTSIFEFFNNVPQKHDVQLALIPLGTGNSLAHSSHIKDEFHALQLLFKDSPAVKLPLYKVTFPEESVEIWSEEQNPVKELYFGIVVSWAIHSQIVYLSERPELKHLGVERFKVAFGEVLQTNLGYSAELTDLKGEPLSNSKYHSYLNVLPVSEMEKGYVISPDSKISEDKLHLILFSELNKEQILPLITLPYQNGAHIGQPGVSYKELKDGLVIKIGEKENERANFCVDGIIVQVKNPKGKEVKVERVPDNRFNIKIIGLQD